MKECICQNNTKFPECITYDEMINKFSSPFALKLEIEKYTNKLDCLFYYPTCKDKDETLQTYKIADDCRKYKDAAEMLLEKYSKLKDKGVFHEQALIDDKLNKLGFFDIFCKKCYLELKDTKAEYSKKLCSNCCDQKERAYIKEKEEGRDIGKMREKDGSEINPKSPNSRLCEKLEEGKGEEEQKVIIVDGKAPIEGVKGLEEQKICYEKANNKVAQIHSKAILEENNLPSGHNKSNILEEHSIQDTTLLFNIQEELNHPKYNELIIKSHNEKCKLGIEEIKKFLIKQKYIMFQIALGKTKNAASFKNIKCENCEYQINQSIFVDIMGSNIYDLLQKYFMQEMGCSNCHKHIYSKQYKCGHTMCEKCIQEFHSDNKDEENCFSCTLDRKKNNERKLKETPEETKDIDLDKSLPINKQIEKYLHLNEKFIKSISHISNGKPCQINAREIRNLMKMNNYFIYKSELKDNKSREITAICCNKCQQNISIDKLIPKVLLNLLKEHNLLFSCFKCSNRDEIAQLFCEHKICKYCAWEFAIKNKVFCDICRVYHVIPKKLEKVSVKVIKAAPNELKYEDHNMKLVKTKIEAEFSKIQKCKKENFHDSKSCINNSDYIIQQIRLLDYDIFEQTNIIVKCKCQGKVLEESNIRELLGQASVKLLHEFAQYISCSGCRSRQKLTKLECEHLICYECKKDKMQKNNKISCPICARKSVPVKHTPL